MSDRSSLERQLREAWARIALMDQQKQEALKTIRQLGLGTMLLQPVIGPLAMNWFTPSRC